MRVTGQLHTPVTFRSGKELSQFNAEKVGLRGSMDTLKE